MFSVATIAMLLIFQVLLLEPMYETSKVNAIKAVGDEIAASIDEDDLEEVVMRSSMQNDACVVLSYNDEALSMKNQMCATLSSMTREELNTIVGYAMASEDNTYMNVTEEWEGTTLFQNNEFKHIIYARVVAGEYGNAVIFIYSGISPISATVRTVTSQLYIIAGMMLVLIIALTFIIYRGIAKPLIQITEAAKYLPEGKYEVDANTNKYREAEELNKTLTEAARDIQKADKAKRDLISNVSHDLRTPLTMISGYGEMMRDLPGEKTDENIQVIIDESKRLNNLVNDLLDLSKLQDNRIILEKQEFDLTKMIEMQIRKYDVYRYKDGFDIQVEGLEKSAYILGDQKRLEQVFNNFMINAINYSTDKKKIIVREILSDHDVRIEVQDFGEGIEESKLPDIWDRYYKIDKTHVRATQGSGIGLSIVKEILSLHGFEYGVNSKVNEGSTFYFIVPLQEQSEA